MSKLIPFLYLDNALEAIEFYKEVFNAKVQGEITMLENIPGNEKFKGKVGHCSIMFDDTVIFIGSTLEEYPLDQGDDIQLVMDLGSKERLHKVFESLLQDGKLKQELHEVFWGALFGSVKDKFGVTWQIYYGHK